MKMKKIRQMLALTLSLALLGSPCRALAADSANASAESAVLYAANADTEEGGKAALDAKEASEASGKKVRLRVCNWEEYIDLGGWDEEETIDLESGDIIGVNPIVEDFEEWYKETYGIDVEVEYSTFGTNEDLYNMLTLGDVYDVVCPSEYMFMKLISEDKVVPLSEQFFDAEDENNFYTRGVSPYIKNIFEEHEINGKHWSDYAAGYMWGLTGIVFNPEKMTREEAFTWKVLNNPKFKRQVTIKDNVRDAYFAAVAAIKHDLLTDLEFTSSPDYSRRLEEEMNEISSETIQAVQDYLQDVRENAYSFETDSGKADMVTGKVVANLQWSGDAVYTLDQAEEDGVFLEYVVPEEVTNIYFDGWIMLKAGIEGDAAKQHAAEAFINFLSRPDNVIRNMYYIGYTSVIAGGDDSRIFEYCDWCYGAETDDEDEEAEDASDDAEEEEASDDAEDGAGEADDTENSDDGEDVDGAEEEETVEYHLGYFFSGDVDDEDYVIEAPLSQVHRQLAAQYPAQDVIARSSIMVYFNEEQNEVINRMWINVRCFNILDVPVWVWVLLGVVVLAGIGFILYNRQRKKKMYD